MKSETHEPLIQVSGARKQYGEIAALAEVDLEVSRGETLGILGANGAGKTTLIESIVGARELDSGEIRVCGYSPRTNRAECAARISIQPQGSALFKNLTVKETIELWASFYPAPKPVEDILELIDLQTKANIRIKHLSGGQQQRVRLGLALVGNTDVVALDEPTVGLDPLARELVWDIIRQRAGQGAVLMATQMMDEAEQLCDRVVFIDSGRVVLEGEIGDLLNNYGGEGSVLFKSQSLVDMASLENLPGVLWASARKVGSGTSVRLISSDVRATERAIHGMGPSYAERVTTRSPSLGDVFLRVVGKELESLKKEGTR